MKEVLQRFHEQSNAESISDDDDDAGGDDVEELGIMLLNKSFNDDACTCLVDVL